MEKANTFHTTDIVSVTLVLFVVFASTTSVFYPKDEDRDFALRMAIFYGLDIVAIVMYFICTQLDLFSYGEKQNKTINVFLRHKIFDKCLIFNLFLTTIAFLLFVVYAFYLPYKRIILELLFNYTLTVEVSWLKGLLGYILIINILLGLILGGSATVVTSAVLLDRLIKFTKRCLSH